MSIPAGTRNRCIDIIYCYLTDIYCFHDKMSFTLHTCITSYANPELTCLLRFIIPKVYITDRSKAVLVICLSEFACFLCQFLYYLHLLCV